MKRLTLLRHAKSSWDDPGLDDYHRPLNPRGRRDAPEMGRRLKATGQVPDLLISSPAVRAITTARMAAREMGFPEQRIIEDRSLYHASAGQPSRILLSLETLAGHVMLVGHNPGLERLLSYLCGKTKDLPKKGQLLPTAALARLAMPDDWSDLARGAASLLRLQHAAKLPRRFPFPGPDGSEQRDRPAYYYTQSAVIPYRIRDGHLEILLVRSGGDKHWVVPKGIVDPGHSPQEAALKEAWEEAGIEGEVDNEPLGGYRYPKWGAHCSVAVYPMAVSREIPIDEWEEPERGPLASPGPYTATLEQRGDEGSWTALAGPVDFEVEALQLATLTAADQIAWGSRQSVLRFIERIGMLPFVIYRLLLGAVIVALVAL